MLLPMMQKEKCPQKAVKNKGDGKGANSIKKPFFTRVSYCKYLCTEYISTIELLIGVPVAKIVPRLPVISSR